MDNKQTDKKASNRGFTLAYFAGYAVGAVCGYTISELDHKTEPSAQTVATVDKRQSSDTSSTDTTSFAASKSRWQLKL